MLGVLWRAIGRGCLPLEAISARNAEEATAMVLQEGGVRGQILQFGCYEAHNYIQEVHDGLRNRIFAAPLFHFECSRPQCG